MGQSNSIIQKKSLKIKFIYQNSQAFVIKYYDDMKSYRNEIYCYLQFKEDPHFLSMIHWAPCYIILPFIQYDLFYIVHNYELTVQEFDVLFLKMVYLVKELHAKKIEHNDIKLENFVLNPNWDVFLIDFEFMSRKNTGSFLYNGTSYYLPPESCINSLKFEFGKKDVWSLGIIYWIYIHRKYPIDYPCRTNFYDFEKLLDDSLPPFLLSCLKFNPMDRFSSRELYDFLMIHSEN